MSDTSQGKYSQINVHVHIKNLLAFATTNNLRSLFLGENCAGFLKGARGYVGWGKASQSSIPSIPARSWAGAPSLQGYFPGVKKKRFQPSSADSLACELALCYFEFRFTAQPPTISSAAAYGKNDWNPWYCHTLLFDCIPSFHTSILSSLPQCSTVFIPHTMVSLSVVLSAWRWAGARLLSWPPCPG